jgi:oligoendopeptidase F
MLGCGASDAGAAFSPRILARPAALSRRSRRVVQDWTPAEGSGTVAAMNTIACLVLAAAAAEAPAYHVDLARYFADAATEQAERTALLGRLEAYTHAQVLPRTPDALLKWLDEGQALSRELERHDAYVYLRGEADTSDRADADADEGLGQSSTELRASMQTSLARMDGPRLERWMASSPALAPWRWFVAGGREQATADARGARADMLLATPALERLGESYQRLRRAVAPPAAAASVPAPGPEQAFAAQWQPYLEHEADFAALLVPIVTLRDGLARLQGYDGGPEAAYARAGLSTAQVSEALAAVKASPVYRHVQAARSREAAARKHAELAELQPWDLEAADTRDGPSFDFTQAVQDVLVAVHSMGPIYASQFQRLFAPDSGRVEWCRAAACDDTGFSVGYSGVDSALFFGRFHGDIDSVRALAHEAAHAVHRQFMRERQPIAFYNEGPHFMFESFALFNEMLVLDQLERTAASAGTRASAGRALVDDAVFQVFGSALQTDLEQAIYFGVRDGRVRSAADLDGLTRKIREAYLEPRLAPATRAYWARQRLYFTDPMYSVNYLFAGLLALAYLHEFERDPHGFALRYVALLENGFDAPPRTLLKKFLDLDVDDVGGLVAGATAWIEERAAR